MSAERENFVLLELSSPDSTATDDETANFKLERTGTVAVTDGLSVTLKSSAPPASVIVPVEICTFIPVSMDVSYEESSAFFTSSASFLSSRSFSRYFSRSGLAKQAGIIKHISPSTNFFIQNKPFFSVFVTRKKFSLLKLPLFAGSHFFLVDFIRLFSSFFRIDKPDCFNLRTMS